MLTLQPRIKSWASKGRAPMSFWAALAFQFLVSIYGGYFGAGMGIMMLAVFGLSMPGTVHELNAVKAVLAVAINVVATIVFVAKGMAIVAYLPPLAVGAIVGGYVGARLSLRVDGERLRVAIALYGFAMTGFFVWRAWKGHS